MKKYKPVWLTLLFILFFTIRVQAHDYAMSFLYGGTNEQYINCVQNAGGVLNSVSPDYFEINEDGSLKTNKLDRHFITAMHDKGVQVVPFISNHWDRKLGQAALDNAESLTAEIARTVYEYNLDGVNVDIENINEKHKDDYTYFVASLRHKMPERTLSVSVAANPHDWQTGWHGSYDYKRLAENSDYLLVMGYDESYYGSKPGPVASAAFTEKSIEYALKNAPPEKIVLGIPFFGRYWKQGDTIGGHGITVMDINNLIEQFSSQKVFHDDTQSAQLTLTINDRDARPKVWGGRTLEPGTYDIWYDDMQSTAYKLSLVNRYHLRGSGSWALGQDTKEMWNAYAQYKTGTAVMATPAPNTAGIQNILPSYTQAPVNTGGSVYTPAPAAPYPNTTNTRDIAKRRPEIRYIMNSPNTTRSLPTQATGSTVDQAGNTSSSGIYTQTGITAPSGVYPSAANTQPLNDLNANSVNSTPQANAMQNNMPQNNVYPQTGGNPNTATPPQVNANMNTNITPQVNTNPNMDATTQINEYSNPRGTPQTAVSPFNTPQNSNYPSTGAYPQTNTIQGGAYPQNNTTQGGAYPQVNTTLSGTSPQTSTMQGSVSPQTNNTQGGVYPQTSTAQGGAPPQTNTTQGSPYPQTNAPQSGTYPQSGITQQSGAAPYAAYPHTSAAPAPRDLSDEVRSAIAKGWLTESEYNENRYVTQGEAVAFIMKMASALPDSKNLDHFTDTRQHPQSEYIRKARNYGIVTGDRDGRFQPDRIVSRQDLALYLDRVFDLPDSVNFENKIANDLQKGNDTERYYAVQKYLAHGIMTTDANGNFRPYDAVTMGELARVAHKMEGRGLKEIRPLQYDGQQQRKKIMEPR